MSELTTLKYAIIGNPVGHSLSPAIHAFFARSITRPLSYEKIQGHERFFEKQVSDFFNEEGTQLHITAPFKLRAFNMAEKKTKRAELIKAANVLWREDGRLWADNTDGVGFIYDIKRHVSLSTQRVLILGAGGAARAVVASLAEYPLLTISVFNRSEQRLVTLCQDFPFIKKITSSDLIPQFDLIIQATTATDFDLPVVVFQKALFCYDLNYLLHGCTPFVQAALAAGSDACDGLGMLVAQAAESFNRSQGIKPNVSQTIDYLTRG